MMAVTGSRTSIVSVTNRGPGGGKISIDRLIVQVV
jgi:hypothetical protein